MKIGGNPLGGVPRGARGGVGGLLGYLGPKWEAEVFFFFFFCKYLLEMPFLTNKKITTKKIETTQKTQKRKA